MTPPSYTLAGNPPVLRERGGALMCAALSPGLNRTPEPFDGMAFQRLPSFISERRGHPHVPHARTKSTDQYSSFHDPALRAAPARSST